jgi:transposase
MDVYVGGDVSKGYADCCVMDGEVEILREIQLDDTPQRHSRMSELIRECNGNVGPEEKLEIALEATGGLERHWLHLFRELDEADETDLNVYRFDPLVIRRCTEQRLHSNKTGEISARALADYLRLGLAEKKAAYTAATAQLHLSQPGGSTSWAHLREHIRSWCNTSVVT